MCSGANFYEPTKEEKKAYLERAEKELEQRLSEIRKMKESLASEERETQPSGTA